MNRYLVYMIARLLRLKSNPILYWKYAYWFLTNSNSYLLVCMWNIDKNLYRTMFIWELRQLMRKVHDLRGSKFAFAPSVLMDYHRAYIPKGDKDWRPLGVPTLAWRIYGNMLLHILNMAVAPLGDSQHGFVPNRGTLTAWKDIFLKVVKAPYIYETDLKQCFPSISLPLLEAVLIQRWKFPVPVAKFYCSLNYRIMTLPRKKDQKLDESQFNTLKSAHKLNIASSDVYARETRDCLPWPHIEEWNSNTYYSESRMLTQRGDAHVPMVKVGVMREVLLNFLESLKSCGLGDHTGFAHLRAAVAKSQSDPIKIPLYRAECIKFIGTAQGSPLSPLLSAILIDEVERVLPAGVKILKYADDWIFYGSERLESFVEKGEILESLQSLGFTLHMDKSGWVRRGWAWQRRLKFLGLVLENGIRFYSDTRKGQSLIFNKGDMVNVGYDITYALTHSLDQLVKTYWSYWDRGVKNILFILGNFSFAVPMVGDVIAYNLSHHYKEMINFKLASENNEYLYKLLLFIRLIFSLPRRVLISVNFHRLLVEGSKEEAKKFVMELYDEKGAAPGISLAEDHLEPQEGSARKLLFHEEAPYLLRENRGWSPYTKLLHNWRSLFRGYYRPLDITHQPVGFYFDRFTGSPIPANEGRSDVYRVEGSRSISTEVSTFEDIFPLWRYRTLFFTEYNNEYLSKYRNKYTFDNMVKGKLFGLIQSRLYAGSWIMDSIVQNFKFTHRACSLASQLVRVYGKENINSFNGTSYAFNEMSRMLARYSKITVQKHGVKHPPVVHDRTPRMDDNPFGVPSVHPGQMPPGGIQHSIM